MTSDLFSVTIHQTSYVSRGEKSINQRTRLNHQIQAQQVRVIDEDGSQLGVLSKSDALKLADERGLDLVEISPGANPPVCKIVDWGKFNYQKTKQLQKSRKHAKALEVKQMRFGLKIGDHDLQVKMNKVTGFLEAGHKVKLTVFYRGRELAHKELGFKLAERIINDYGDRIIVDQQPQFAGKQLNFVVRQNASYKAPKPEADHVAESKETEAIIVTPQEEENAKAKDA